jgi:hypothetical protein
MAGEGILSCERSFAFFAYKGSRSRIFNFRQFELLERLFAYWVCASYGFVHVSAQQVSHRRQKLGEEVVVAYPQVLSLREDFVAISALHLLTITDVSSLGCNCFLSSNFVAVNSFELFVHVEGREHECGRFVYARSAINSEISAAAAGRAGSHYASGTRTPQEDTQFLARSQSWAKKADPLARYSGHPLRALGEHEFALITCSIFHLNINIIITIIIIHSSTKYRVCR